MHPLRIIAEPKCSETPALKLETNDSRFSLPSKSKFGITSLGYWCALAVVRSKRASEMCQDSDSPGNIGCAITEL